MTHNICIKCDKELYIKIRKYLLSWGFIEYDINYDFVRYPYLVVNAYNRFGYLANVYDYSYNYNRILENDIIDFLNKIYNMNRIKYIYELNPPKKFSEI